MKAAHIANDYVDIIATNYIKIPQAGSDSLVLEICIIRADFFLLVSLLSLEHLYIYISEWLRHNILNTA